MGLSDSPVSAAIAVNDMGRATEFYEGKLGLSGGVDQGDGGRTYPCGGGTRIHVYPSPGNAGKSGATLAFWDVDEAEALIDELIGNGITFEQYGEPFNTDEKGIARFDGLITAWFKDPDGNVLAVGQT
jgi:catechol 2,3-dioxygenase-like lactoylglutathione lyase family enzyme